MSDTVETIEVDPRTRIRVEYDTDADDPRGWGDHVKDDDDVVTRWRNGEVYGVCVELLITYTRADTGATMQRWEEEDSIWGCYLDDTYTARMVANEYFGIPLEVPPGNPDLP